MLRSKIHKLVFFLSLSSSLPSMAQTAVWLMPPASYSDCTYLGKGLFKLVKNGKVGLLDASGAMVAPCEYTALTPFYEGKALLTQSTPKGDRVVGCIDEQGIFHRFSKDYYTLQGQAFYSDGVLSVSNGQGKLGYIDQLGNEVVGFDGKYDRIKPFTEGYAAVFRKKAYRLIDKTGNEVQFRFSTVGELYGGTNAYKGEVYVWDTDGVFYVYNTQRGGVCQKRKLPSGSRSFDYLYRLSCITGQSRTLPTTEYLVAGKRVLSPVSVNGLMGYQQDSDEVLPPQFTSASDFVDSYAMVNTSQGLGILRYVDGQKLDVVGNSSPVKYYGTTATCRLSLSVPEAWVGKSLQVYLIDDEGRSLKFKAHDSYFTFDFSPHRSQHTFTAEVENEGLIICRKELTYQFNHRIRCVTCGRDVADCSYHGKHPVAQPKTAPTSTPASNAQKKKEKLCSTCGLPISKCKYQGVH